jgi:VIT1/CCC1 family predicted Fe2+/Mn2+ transporter
MQDLSRFSFGATSAVTSSLALMIGLNQLEVPKLGIIGALLVIAFADNIADSLGMHIYAESKSKSHTNLNTISNYFTRLGITLLLVVFVLVLPPPYSIAASIIFGLIVMAALSYLIARSHGMDPRRVVAEHLIVMISIVLTSQFLGSAIRALFN